jgi:hypothetical protein
MRSDLRSLAAALLASLLSASSLAAVTQFVGRTSAGVTERLVATGELLDSEEQSDEYLSTGSETLPLQSVARVVDPNDQAAGVSAAQFADPRTASGPDTDQFSVNLALAVDRPDARFNAFASSVEERGILISSAEANGLPAGASFNATGRFFVDGALTIFATTEAADLTGSSVKLRVRVERVADGGDRQTVFDAGLELAGAGDAVNTTRNGAFPESGVFSIDLPQVDETLSVFRIVVFPDLQFDYAYSVVVGQPFTLVATVEVEGQTGAEGVGVAALIGTPATALVEVVSATIDDTAAAKMNQAVQRERAAPSGEPAFAAPPLDFGPFNFLGACGLYGVEAAVGALAMIGLRFSRRDR